MLLEGDCRGQWTTQYCRRRLKKSLGAQVLVGLIQSCSGLLPILSNLTEIPDFPQRQQIPVQLWTVPLRILRMWMRTEVYVELLLHLLIPLSVLPLPPAPTWLRTLQASRLRTFHESHLPISQRQRDAGRLRLHGEGEISGEESWLVVGLGSSSPPST